MNKQYQSEAERLQGLSREELVRRASAGETNSLTGRTGRLILMNKIADVISGELRSLTDAITEASSSQDRLSRGLWWLNFLVAVATVVMAVAAAIQIREWWIAP